MTEKPVSKPSPSATGPSEEPAAAAPLGSPASTSSAHAAPLPPPLSQLWGGMSPLSQLLWKSRASSGRGVEVTTNQQLRGHAQAPAGLIGAEVAEGSPGRIKGSRRLRLGRRMQKLNGVNMSATLTWKDLGVRATNASGETHTLLDGLTGYAEPGNILAIMGPSGSGKSTLLDALAGRLARNTSQTGEILLNGCRTQRSYGTAAYVTQEDSLIGTLTVRETIHYTAQLRLPDRMSKADKAAIVESTMVDMGLQECANTYIGNWHLRGLSGGEKRRVSIALEILTRPRLLFLDEPTSGLDSASAFFVTSTLLNLARDGRTVIASIHQPSSEVFQLFDDLTLLSGGKLVYFGEALAACEHFASAGFPCPPLRNPSDHFLRAINSDFDRVKATLRGSFKIKADAEAQTSDPLDKISASQAVKVLIDAYQTSDAAMMAAARVHELSHMESTVLESAGSQASSFTQAYTLTCRSFINMSRDMGYYWLRLVIYILLTLCIGTIYYKLGKDYNSIMARAACMSYIAGFLTFMAIGGFPSFVEDMKVFHRERLNGHYGVVAFVIGNTLSSLPYLLLISLASGSICYFMVQLHPGFSHFAYFVLALFACVTVVESLMMAVASVVPNFLMGIITGAGIQGIFMLLAGFFRLPNDLPKPFWRYPMSYFSFHMYALQGMYQNEFLGVTFNSLFPGFHVTGDKVIVENYQINIQRNKWWDLGILASMVVIYRVIFFLCIKMNEDVQPFIRLLIARYSSKYLARKKSALQKSIRPENTSPPPRIRIYTNDVTPQQAIL